MRVPSARSPGVGLAKVPQRAYLDLSGATAWDISPVGSRGNLDLMQYALIFFDVQLILAQMGQRGAGRRRSGHHTTEQHMAVVADAFDLLAGREQLQMSQRFPKHQPVVEGIMPSHSRR